MKGTYLKCMDIHGFRSYEKKSRIEFSPNVNVVLGSHESGKSNILEAIKWCLAGSDGGQEWVLFRGSSEAGFAEVVLTFGGEGEGTETVLRRRVECDGRNGIARDERFVNDEPVAEGYFSRCLFSSGFISGEVEADGELSIAIRDGMYCNDVQISVFRFLPVPLCLVDDSLSPSDELLNQTVASVVKGLAVSSQCIVVSRLRQLAVEADRLIGVRCESGSSTVMELARQKED